ncbi:MAG: hypothetical protein HYY06_09175 [Deltaproteobacteria bacterium]|nr:hypothetical protein [Deltaproteobacteria bacterium]
MRIARTPEFAEERERFRLRHVCEECAHHDPDLDECAHGYPTTEHCRAYYDREARGDLVFCKEFELR